MMSGLNMTIIYFKSRMNLLMVLWWPYYILCSISETSRESMKKNGTSKGREHVVFNT